MLIRVMLSEELPDPPTVIDVGGEGLWLKRESLLSIEKFHAPISISVVNIRRVPINCIRCDKYFLKKLPFGVKITQGIYFI